MSTNDEKIKCWIDAAADNKKKLVRFNGSDQADELYKVTLSLDGGGTRCIVSVMLLKKLETKIKDYLKANGTVYASNAFKTEDSTFFTDNSDFDILLGDYVDYLAGVSMGGCVATYIASYGEGSDALFENEDFLKDIAAECTSVANGEASEKLLVDKAADDAAKKEWKDLAGLNYASNTTPPNSADKAEFVSELKKVLPKGSIKRLEVAFVFCVYHMIPCNKLNSDPKKNNSTPANRVMELTTRSLAMEKDEREMFMGLLFGEETTAILKKKLMLLAFDMIENEDISFVMAPDPNDPDDVTVMLKTLKHGEQDDVNCSANSIGTQQTYKSLFPGRNAPKLTKLTSGSAAVFGAGSHVDVPFDEDGNSGSVVKRRLTDGAIISNDPTLLATLLHPDGTLDMTKNAILSIGTGLSSDVESDTCSAVPSIPDRDPVYLYSLTVEASSRLTTGVLQTYLATYNQQAADQYLRIQYKPKDQNTLRALRDLLNSFYIDDLHKFGEQVAAENADDIDAFVRDRIFGKP